MIETASRPFWSNTVHKIEAAAVAEGLVVQLVVLK